MADIPGYRKHENHDPDAMSAVQYSGTTTLLQADGFEVPVTLEPVGVGVGGRKVSVLRSRCHRPNEAGLASVHIQSSTLNPALRTVGGPKTRILAKIVWQSGRGGGEATVDITRGSVFSIGGAYSVQVDAYRRLNDPLVAQPAAADLLEKRIDATVHWSTSISPKSAMVTGDSVTVAAGNTSGFIIIPSQAQSVILISDVPAALAATDLQFFLGAARQYSTTNPFSNGTPIVHGVEALKIANGSGVQAIYIPVFELWL